MSTFLIFLQDFKDRMARDLYKTTTEEAIKTGLCIQCKESALPNCYSAEGIREYRISGLCERCFDKITLEISPNDDDIPF
jgi:hypothetical protein